MRKLIIGFGPLILIYLLAALGLSLWFDDYVMFLVMVAGPTILALVASVILAIVCWLAYVFEEG